MSMTRAGVAALMVAATWMFGCSDDGAPPAPPPAGPTFTRVTKEVITGKSCGSAACHDLAMNGFALGAKDALHRALVDQVAGGSACGPNPDGGASPTYIRVKPGDPE